MVMRVYGIVLCLLGLVLAAWGPLWLGTDLPGVPLGKAALIRLHGAAIVVMGCFGAAMGEVHEPKASKRGFWWLFGAQVVGFQLMRTQLTAIWGESALLKIVDLATALLVLFFWLVTTSEGLLNVKTWKPLTLFGGGAEQELRSRYEEQIRAAAAQEERHRLARELHDSIKQQIFVVQTAAATAQARYGADDEGTREALTQVRGAAREAMAEMEAMLDQLRAAPLENAGLVAALQQQCEALGIRTGAAVEFTPGSMPANEAMPPGSQQAMFRVAQEALANVGRHARAGKVDVRVERIGNEVRLRVADDGAGFDTNSAPRGMGLSNMRARAEEHGGVVEVASRPGGGTVVELRIPCEREEGADADRHLKLAFVWLASGGMMGYLLFVLGRWSMLNAALLGIAAAGAARSFVAWRCLKRKEAR